MSKARKDSKMTIQIHSEPEESISEEEQIELFLDELAQDIFDLLIKPKK